MKYFRSLALISTAKLGLSKALTAPMKPCPLQASPIIPRLPPLLPIPQNGPDYQLIQNPQDTPAISTPLLKEKEGDVFADFLGMPSLSQPSPNPDEFPFKHKALTD
ncbi:hypothetical protein H0H87_007869 [Tephrocybe sp. NHM501043]|nr:hypothetical protein H0H87_007869 [Tephrocybe sp. NHM501043]